jgi:hypothetical protein
MASKPTHRAAPATHHSSDHSSHSLLGRMDMIDQMILLLVGIVLLLVNLGLIDPQLIAFWPLVLVIIAIKEILQSN